MSGESEEPGESMSDRACRRNDARALDEVVRAAEERGVVFQDPYTAYLDPHALIEAGAWVGAGTHILGNTRIERDARVGPNAIVEDSRVGRGAIIQPFSSVIGGSVVESGAVIKQRSELSGSVISGNAEIGPNALIEDSRIASKAKVGPFCRVRAGSEIGVDAYIGTQAEVKASRIGDGSKVGHFSFVGDAVLGRAVNIGAGSVTANHDGQRVQNTVIEDRVSIGAGTLLVAPLRLGSEARTGAGAVVTRDVADGELVFGVPARIKPMQQKSI